MCRVSNFWSSFFCLKITGVGHTRVLWGFHYPSWVERGLWQHRRGRLGSPKQKNAHLFESFQLSCSARMDDEWIGEFCEIAWVWDQESHIGPTSSFGSIKKSHLPWKMWKSWSEVFQILVCCLGEFFDLCADTNLQERKKTRDTSERHPTCCRGH